MPRKRAFKSFELRPSTWVLSQTLLSKPKFNQSRKSFPTYIQSWCKTYKNPAVAAKALKMKTLEFRIRKLHVNTDVEKRLQKKQPSRVYVSEDALIELTGSRDGGKTICIERAASSTDEAAARREATLWKAPEKLDKSVTQMYDAFRDACGYKLGEHVRITALGGILPDAEEVTLDEISAPTDAAPGQDTAQPQHPIPTGDVPGWEFFLAGRLSLTEHVHAGLVFKKAFLRGPERSFVVTSVNGSPTGNARYVDRNTAVRIVQAADAQNGVDCAAIPRTLAVTGIRGLDSQVRKLNDLLRCNTALRGKRYIPNTNIVIHGGHGTGKSMLLEGIARTGWGNVFRIQVKDKLSEIQDVFQKAKLQQPSMILVDDFDRVIDKDRNNRSAVILAFCEALDALAAEAETKGEAPNVFVVAACQDYTSDVPEDLKMPNRFNYELYLPLPDVGGRREILSSFDLLVEPDKATSVLNHLSERTHAYNGHDLKRLIHHGQRLGCLRVAEQDAARPSGEEGESSLPPFYCALQDYETALKDVRPSAMHDINLKPPPIHWNDIGGQDSVKKSLRRAVQLSTAPPQLLSWFLRRAPKGFLLYGPPGCSKTMAAQAMATESGLNFFAVKGAELLNMYVGESERAVRRLFQRAREVAPSMIFFDEIDSIAGQRHGFGHNGGGGSSSTTSHGGLNVLTTLLNEMDGFEALQGVIVLAATNRPQVLDPALLRPGRFDELIYVSPPDEEARKAIFRGVSEKRRMHSDVDLDALARDTNGYSGAEIVGICAAAGMAAYDRYCEQMASTGGDVDGENGIKMQDFVNAIKNQRRQITRQMVEGFEEWERQFRKH